MLKSETNYIKNIDYGENTPEIVTQLLLLGSINQYVMQLSKILELEKL